MGFLIYLDPQEPGPFTNLPQQSMVFSNGYAIPTSTTTALYRMIERYGRILPTYAFTTRKPTGPTDRVEIPFSFSIPHTVTTVSTGYVDVAAPICMGFLQIDIDRTINYNTLIANMVTGQSEPQKWQVETKISSNGTMTGGGACEARGSIGPACCYVMRPSTGNLVGWFWSAHNITTNGCWGMPAGILASTNWVAARCTNQGGYGMFWGYAASGPRCVEVTYLQNIAIQSGDVLVVEYWAMGHFTSLSGAKAVASPVTLSGIMSIGGGTDYTTAPYGDTGGVITEASATYNTTMPLGLAETSGTLPVSIPVREALPGAADLITVTPMTGPVLRLGFSNPVGITGPTISGPVDGLGVTGATQYDTTHIDLACAIRPDHPDGDANNATMTPPIGEADPLGPPVPTGVGATII